ncbi:MAG: hypothetical protein AB7P35_17825 [Hyphomonadaceae bacterium]
MMRALSILAGVVTGIVGGAFVGVALLAAPERVAMAAGLVLALVAAVAFFAAIANAVRAGSLGVRTARDITPEDAP